MRARTCCALRLTCLFPGGWRACTCEARSSTAWCFELHVYRVPVTRHAHLLCISEGWRSRAESRHNVLPAWHMHFIGQRPGADAGWAGPRGQVNSAVHYTHGYPQGSVSSGLAHPGSQTPASAWAAHQGGPMWQPSYTSGAPVSQCPFRSTSTFHNPLVATVARHTTVGARQRTHSTPGCCGACTPCSLR